MYTKYNCAGKCKCAKVLPAIQNLLINCTRRSAVVEKAAHTALPTLHDRESLSVRYSLVQTLLLWDILHVKLDNDRRQLNIMPTADHTF